MAQKKPTGIAVIESKWWPNSNASVQGLFNTLSDIFCDNHHGYHYETANNHQTLKEVIARVGAMRKCRTLFIACHGDVKGLDISEKSKQYFTSKKLADAICKVSGSSVDGLYLSCCNFGSEKTAATILGSKAKVNWVAGYREEVDWMSSSAFDMLFFNVLLDKKHRKGKKTSDREQIEKVAKTVVEQAEGLISQLGFQIYVKKKGGGVVDLIDVCRKKRELDVRRSYEKEFKADKS